MDRFGDQVLDEHFQDLDNKPPYLASTSHRLESCAINIEIFPLYFDIAWRSWVCDLYKWRTHLVSIAL